jgi:ubiquitin carboxyl-terminal hydrolase 9/24
MADYDDEKSMRFIFLSFSLTLTHSISRSNEELISGFPVAKLHTLNHKINSPRWVVPVLPDQELEVLLNYAIKLSKANVDYDCEFCMKFYREGLTISFMKILTDEAVNSWKLTIHTNILMLCGKLLELCSLHMKADNPILLDLLAMVFDGDNKFHTHNASKNAELFSNQESPSEGVWGTLFDNQLFAKSPSEPRQPRGWLVDLINRFGQLGGFDHFLERFNIGINLMKIQFEEISNDPQSSGSSTSDVKPTEKTTEESNKLTLPLIYYLLRPFGQCYELFTPKTIEKYFQPIWKPIIEILNNMSDEDLKRDAKLDGKNDIVNGIIKYSKMLISRCSNAENLIKELEMCRLKIILRVLQISSFNGKMNALNEINKMLSYVSYYPHRHQQSDDECETMTAEKLAKWIKDVDVLGIVLKDSLHQPQYVEKLEKIVRFLIKEKSLSLEDLAAIWRAQAGKHEAIVKNVHDLLAKLAWDFNAEQLDYLFDCFQVSLLIIIHHLLLS